MTNNVAQNTKDMVLNCSIKKVYLDMIVSGAKKTEYRDMSEYWVKKICNLDAYSDGLRNDIPKLITKLQKGEVDLHTKDWTEIRFWCDKQVLTYKITDIKIYKGHKIFAIGLGDEVKKQ